MREGVDLASSWEAKFGARSSQGHQINGKKVGRSDNRRRKNWGKPLILGRYLKFKWKHLEYLSSIFLEANSRRISEAILGLSPRPPDMNVPLGLKHYLIPTKTLKLKTKGGGGEGGIIVNIFAIYAIFAKIRQILLGVSKKSTHV